MTSKQRCLAAIRGEPVDRTPVFPLLMFLAADRAGISYRRFATDARAMAEAQVNIYRRFGVDAITACSDAFRIVADLGGEMIYPEDKPPYAAKAVFTCQGDVDRAARPDPADPNTRMADRVRATAAMADAVGDECLVLGWVDLPFAEACSACGVTAMMLLCVDDPPLAHRVLEFLTEIVIDFAVAQVAVGAPMIGAGDAAASLISPAMYAELALPYERRVVEAVHHAGGLVKLHICGNTAALLEPMTTCGADLFNVDHLVAFDRACDVYGRAGKCFKGNLDPVADMLQATPDACRARARACIDRAAGLRYMLSPGCEVPAGVSDEVFAAFCDAARA